MSMKKINIGGVIFKNRKLKSLTQEELANFLGVSKAAISKWESGQSYPDITFLPVLATFFNISVDTLIGYEPEMLVKDIRKLYVELSKEFANNSFQQVYEKCISYGKKYYSCWKLQFHIGLLFINNMNLAPDPMKILIEAKEIFSRVAKESEDIGLVKQALQLEALCYIQMNEPMEAIEILEGIVDIHYSPEILLSKAYGVKGDVLKAKSVLQSFIYQNLIEVVVAFPDLIMFYSDDYEKSKECFEKVTTMCKTFGFDKIHLSSYITILLSYAQVLVMNNKIKEALEIIEIYVKIFNNSNFKEKLRGNEFFDLIDDLIDSLDLGGELPRDERLIRASMKEVLVNNPIFEGLKSNERFNILINRMEV